MTYLRSPSYRTGGSEITPRCHLSWCPGALTGEELSLEKAEGQRTGLGWACRQSWQGGLPLSPWICTEASQVLFACRLRPDRASAGPRRAPLLCLPKCTGSGLCVLMTLDPEGLSSQPHHFYTVGQMAHVV